MILGVLAFPATIVSAALAVYFKDSVLAGSLFAIWAILPPLWFAFEYFHVYRLYGDPDLFDEFKHGQHVTATIWLGLAAFLGALANSLHQCP